MEDLYSILKQRLPFLKAPEFIAWRRARLPESKKNWTYHHLLGSYIGKKTTDYIGIFLPPDVHTHELQARLNSQPEEYFAESIIGLIEYIEHKKSVEKITDSK